MSEKFVSVAEASVILGVGVHTLKKKLKAGKLSGKLTADGWMVRIVDTEILCDERSVPKSDIQKKEETTMKESQASEKALAPASEVSEELPQVVDQEEGVKEESEKEETYDDQAEEDKGVPAPKRGGREGAGWWF